MYAVAPSGECLRDKSPPDPWRRLFLAAFGLNLVAVAVLRDKMVSALRGSVGTSYIVAVLRDRLLSR